MKKAIIVGTDDMDTKTVLKDLKLQLESKQSVYDKALIDYSVCCSVINNNGAETVVCTLDEVKNINNSIKEKQFIDMFETTFGNDGYGRNDVKYFKDNNFTLSKGTYNYQISNLDDFILNFKKEISKGTYKVVFTLYDGDEAKKSSDNKIIVY